MRPHFEKSHFLVIYAMLCKYNKNRLPSELVLDIKNRLDIVRKELRQNYAKEKFGKGVSKLSAKRRARRFNICFKCGKFLHPGACSRNQTPSNYEYVTLCKEGPVQCRNENYLNRRGTAYQNMKSEIIRLKERAERIGYKL